MQATQHRPCAHPEALAEPMAGQWCHRRHDEAGQIGKQLNDDSSQRDHATIMPQLGEGSATGSVRPGSNICGAQPASLHLVPRNRGRHSGHRFQFQRIQLDDAVAKQATVALDLAAKAGEIGGRKHEAARSGQARQ